MKLKKYKKYFSEKQDDIKIGDEILTGKFKNHKEIVTGFDTDDNNQPIILCGSKKIPLYKVRIKKLIPKNIKK